jgi:hypothetical protein
MEKIKDKRILWQPANQVWLTWGGNIFMESWVFQPHWTTIPQTSLEPPKKKTPEERGRPQRQNMGRVGSTAHLVFIGDFLSHE